MAHLLILGVVRFVTNDADWPQIKTHPSLQAA
jgi:hypothetical protein